MKKLIFVLLCFLYANGSSGQICSNCSTNITGNDTLTYNVGSGQIFCVAKSGNFLGKITVSGGTVCVAGNFNPNTINIASGAITNNGNATLNSSITLPSSFQIKNNSGAILSISGSVTLDSSTITNNGILNVVESINNSGTIVNTNIINCVQLSGSGTVNDTGIINSN
jgi:hypothetical protein